MKEAKKAYVSRETYAAGRIRLSNRHSTLSVIWNSFRSRSLAIPCVAIPCPALCQNVAAVEKPAAHLAVKPRGSPFAARFIRTRRQQLPRAGVRLFPRFTARLMRRTNDGAPNRAMVCLHSEYSLLRYAQVGSLIACFFIPRAQARPCSMLGLHRPSQSLHPSAIEQAASGMRASESCAVRSTIFLAAKPTSSQPWRMQSPFRGCGS